MKYKLCFPRIGGLIAGSVFLYAIFGCTTVPDTERRALNFIPPSQEMELGLSAFQKYKQTKPISYNREYNAMTRRVAARLTKVVPVQDAAWEFVVFEDESPNAFALPGGKVGVHSGMFKVVENESQLAAVIGHELGHVVARHGGERMSRTMTVAGVGAVAAAALNRSDQVRDTNKTKILAAYGAGAAIGVILPHSRAQELEADELGALYMARAGYDPREAVTLWVNFSNYKQQNGGANVPDFLSTHPADSVRIGALKEFIPQVMPVYERTQRGNFGARAAL